MKKIVVGVIVMMLGVFLLFRNLNFIPWEISHFVFTWQSLLIALGAIFLFDRKADTKNVGVILILVGTVFLLKNVIGSGILFPAIIIAIGIFILILVTTKKSWWGKNTFVHSYEWKENDWKKYDCTNNTFNTTSVDGNGRIKREYVFNGSKEKWTYGKLRNVVIEAVFSGVELDFTQTELADDIKGAAHIKISSVFSGITLYVPDDWNIMVQKTGVFGGFVDNRPRSVEQNINKDKLVILELEAVFGGGEIKCYE